ncbi:MAG: ArgP/LysG family DNA-binding transcriptional regulator [Nocardioides sp.]
MLTEAEAALGEYAAAELAVTVNADSLATWLRPALVDIADWDAPVALRLTIEDQEHSQELLRAGRVLAAVTSDPTAVQGCSVELLGTLRYLPVATRDFADRWRRGNRLDWARMPVVVFNAKDRLQHQQLTARGIERPAVVHQVPSSSDFCAAVEAGLGWAMLPEPQIADALARGEVVRLGRDRLDVPLYWQRWRLDSPLLDRLTEVVRAAALAGLRP